MEISREANKFEAQPKGNRINLSFVALDEGEGARFQILHTGTVTSTWDLEGHILGAKSIQLLARTPEDDITTRRKARSLINFILEGITVWLVVGLAAGIMLWLRDALPWPSDIQEFMNTTIGFLLCLTVSLMFGVGLAFWLKEESNKIRKRPMRLYDDSVSHKVHAESDRN